MKLIQFNAHGDIVAETDVVEEAEQILRMHIATHGIAVTGDGVLVAPPLTPPLPAEVFLLFPMSGG